MSRRIDRVSVALCTYNGAVFLEEQLRSITRQTRAPDEIVIVDDSSSDQTWQILSDFEASAELNVSVHQNASNLGSTANFNKAIRLCQGDLILLSDQDDIWREDKVETFCNEFERCPEAAFAFSDARLVDEAGQPTGDTLWRKIRFLKGKSHLLPPTFFHRLVQGNVVTGATMGIRRRAFELLPPSPRNWVHDAWIAICLSTAFPAIAIADTLIDYRSHPGQQLGTRGAAGGFAETAARIALGRDASELTARLSRLCSELEAFVAVGSDCEAFQLANPDPVQYVTCVRNHLQQRIRIRNARLLRVPLAMGEFARGNYHRYGHGIASMGRDILCL